MVERAVVAVAVVVAVVGVARQSAAQVIHSGTAPAHVQGFTVSVSGGRIGLGRFGERVEPLSGPAGHLGIEKGLTPHGMLRLQLGHGAISATRSAVAIRHTTIGWATLGIAKILGSAHLRVRPVVEGGASGYRLADGGSRGGGVYAGFGVQARLGRTPALLDGGVRLHLYQTRAVLMGALGIGWEF